MALRGNEGGITCRQKATDIQGGLQKIHCQLVDIEGGIKISIWATSHLPLP